MTPGRSHPGRSLPGRSLPGRSPTLALAAAVAAARASGETVYSLSTPTFPERSASLDLGTASTLLSPPQGASRLRERMRDAMLGRWNLPGHDVLVTAGAKAAILAALRAACNAGDRVVILAPCWPSYADIARMLFMEPVFFEARFEDGFAVDSAALAATVAGAGARAIVLSNPANPTGRIHPGREIDAIAGVARESGALLLIDESFSGFVFAEDKWRGSVCSAYERLVLVNSVSKSHHLQGLRVGMCAAQGELFESIVSAHQTAASAASSLSQAAVLALIDSGSETQDYRRQRSMALEFARDRGWACQPADGSFYVFPRVDGIDAFEAASSARRVFMLRGDAFGSACANHVRLCFGKPAAELDRIFAALRGPASTASPVSTAAPSAGGIDA